MKKEAADNLLRLNMMDYPNMKRDDRRRLFKAIREVAFPIENQKLKSTEDLVRFLDG